MDRSLFALYSTYFLTNLVGLLMTPFYPHVAYSKGVSPVLVGIVFSAMPATAVLCSFGTPYLLKVISRRFAIAVGCILQAASMCVLAASDYVEGYEFFALGLLARIISGAAQALGENSFVGTYGDRAEEIFSLLEMYAGISVTIGPVISAPLYDVLGFQLVFLVSGGVFLATTVLVVWLRETRTLEEKKAKYGVGRILSCRVTPTQPMCMDAMAMTYSLACATAMETYISPHLLGMGMPMAAIGGAIGCEPAGYTVCCIFFSKYLSKINTRLFIAGGLVLVVVGGLLSGPPPGFPPSYWIVIVAITLIGAALGLAFVPCIPHMLEVAPLYGFQADDDLADALGSVGGGAFTLGEMIGPLVGGALLNGMSFQWMMVTVSAAGPVCLAAYLLLGRVSRQVDAVAMTDIDATADKLIEAEKE